MARLEEKISEEWWLNVAQGFNPDHYTRLSAGKRSPSATIDCLEKYRSLVRTKYRLEAYATLRRRVVAVGSRR